MEHGVPGARHPGVGRGRQAGGRRAAAIPVAAGLGAHQPNRRLRLAAEPQTGRREVSAPTDARKTLAYDFFRILRAPHKRMFLRELSSAFTRTKGGEAPPLIRPPEISPRQAEGRASLTGPKSPARASAAMTAAALSRVDDGSGGYRQPLAQPRHRGRTASDLEATGPSHPDMDLDARTDVRFRVLGVLR